MSELIKLENLSSLEDDNAADILLGHVKANAEKLLVAGDITKKKHRDQVRTIAFQVVKSKTLIEKTAKKRAAEIKAEAQEILDRAAKVINLSKTVSAQLDRLRDEIRRPVIEYEAEQARLKAEEKARAVAESRRIYNLRESIAPAFGDTVAELQEKAARARQAFDGEKDERLKEWLANAVVKLRSLANEELRRMRAEIEEAAERARLEQQRIEEERLRAERAEQERLNQAAIAEEARKAAHEARIAHEAEMKRLRDEQERQQVEMQRKLDEAEQARQAASPKPTPHIQLVADTQNPETGKTFREENNELKHTMVVGQRVIVSIETEITSLDRDCDGTPLYRLDGLGGGYSEDSLEPIA